MRYLYYLPILLLLLPAAAHAQNGTLSGRVTDQRSGDPLPGVNVIVRGLNLGAASNLDGNYTLSLPAGTHTVTARFVGFRDNAVTVTISSGQTTTQNFALDEDLLQLDEIVVTGQGASTEKRKLSANVDVLNVRDIENTPVTSVDQLLQGRIAGSSIRAQSAQPGQGANVNFRGITSVFANQTPVIYIDGVRVDNNSGTSASLGGETTSALAELLTSDIERIEVTKGGAASTLYGSDAANGVIQIFTKRGVAGDMRVTFRTEQGIDQPDTKFVQDVDFSFEDVVNDPESNDFGQGDFIKDEFLQTGYFQNYYVGVSGGNAAVTYNVSGRVQNGEGIQPSNDNSLYALRGNIQTQLATNLNVGFSGAYTRSNFRRLNNGTAIADPYTSFQVGDAYFFTGIAGLPNDDPLKSFEEALRRFTLPDIREGVNRFTLSASATYNPSELFTSSLTAGVDARDNEQRVFNDAEFDVVSGDNSGSLNRFDRNFIAVTLEYLGTVSYPRSGNVTSDFTFGIQGFREETSIFTGSAETFALPGTVDLGEAGTVSADENRTQIFNGGLLFREQLGLWNRLFLNAGLRLDGNSAFGDEVGLQAYPAFGAAYTISDEDFWGDGLKRWIGDLKLRASYGETGKFPNAFSRDITFSAVSFRGESAPNFANPGNEDLKPEKTRTIEGGFEASVINNRVGINFTYYDAQTDDALLFVPEQPNTGKGTQLRNVGVIENQGIELDLNASILNSSKVAWSVGFQYAWFQNEITEGVCAENADGTPDCAPGDVPAFNVGGSGSRAQQRVARGEPVGAWRARTPFDSNGDGLLDDSEFRFTGETPFPTRTGSINTNVTLFHNLSIFAMADFALGAQTFDWSSHWASFNGLERTVLPDRFNLDGSENGKFSTTTAGRFLLYDADFLKLRELSVRYGIPRKYTDRTRMKSASVFFTMRNIYTFSRQDLLDPEISGVSSTGGGGLELGGEQSSTLSAPRQFRLGIEIQF